MEIRKATEKDIPAILEIEQECFIKPWGEKDIRYEIFENPVNFFYLLEEGKDIIGFIDFWITFDSATVAQIGIKKEYRGRHLSHLLMQEMIDDCFAKKVISITLEVRTSNLKAISLYGKHGFKRIVIKPHYYENGEDALYMVRSEGGMR